MTMQPLIQFSHPVHPSVSRHIGPFIIRLDLYASLVTDRQADDLSIRLSVCLQVYPFAFVSLIVSSASAELANQCGLFTLSRRTFIFDEHFKEFIPWMIKFIHFEALIMVVEGHSNVFRVTYYVDVLWFGSTISHGCLIVF